jgi:putative acetyltransferase
MIVMHNYAFREGRPEDAVALLHCHTDAIAAFDERIYTAAQKASWAHGLTAASYTSAIADGERFDVAVDQSGRIDAFSRSRSNEVYGLFVHPTAQGQNLGSQLLDRAEKWFRASHAGYVMLDATLHAVPFYKNRGWSLVRIKTMRTRGGLLQEVGLMKKHFA